MLWQNTFSSFSTIKTITLKKEMVLTDDNFFPYLNREPLQKSKHFLKIGFMCIADDFSNCTIHFLTVHVARPLGEYAVVYVQYLETRPGPLQW